VKTLKASGQNRADLGESIEDVYGGAIEIIHRRVPAAKMISPSKINKRTQVLSEEPGGRKRSSETQRTPRPVVFGPLP